jgi:hypothetical protein
MRPTTTTCRARLACERGQALLETALVVPLLALLVLGAVYLGRDFNFANDATQLAGQGARLAAVGNDPPGGLNAWLLNRAKDQSNGFHDAITKVCIDYPDDGGDGDTIREVGEAVRVRITVDLGSIKLPLLHRTGITTTRGATARLEKSPPGSYACPS